MLIDSTGDISENISHHAHHGKTRSVSHTSPRDMKAKSIAFAAASDPFADPAAPLAKAPTPIAITRGTGKEKGKSTATDATGTVLRSSGKAAPADNA